MKQNKILRGGESDFPYASPQLELLEVSIEQGFAASPLDFTSYMNDNGTLSDKDWDYSEI